MKIAVIVPCRNEVNNLEECLRAIYNSIIPASFTIDTVVVDGKSDDGTLELIASLQNEFVTLEVIQNEKQLTPFAFNLGIKHVSDADFFQIVGARQIIDTKYLQKAVANFKRDKEIWCVGGKVQNVYMNEAGRNISAAMSTSFGMGLGNFRVAESSSFVDTVGTPMYPKFVFKKIGYFDEELIRNQDDDFNFRVIKAGGKIYLDTDMLLKYYVRGNFKGLWRQFFQYGYWKVYVNKKHKSVTTLRQLVPPLFVGYILNYLFGCLLFQKTLFVFAFGLPVLLYVAMMIYYSSKIIHSQKETTYFQTAMTFPILHFSYGFGYLKGIFHFLLLSKKPSEREKKLSR